MKRVPGEAKLLDAWVKTGDKKIFPDRCELVVVDLTSGQDISQFCSTTQDSGRQTPPWVTTGVTTNDVEPGRQGTVVWRNHL